MATRRRIMRHIEKKSELVAKLQAAQESAKKVVANLNEAIKGKNGSNVTEQSQSSRPAEDKSK
jgi:hypothetical protein